MSTELSTLRETVLDLEVRLAYQDRAVATLDELVRTLFGRIEALEKEIKVLRESQALPIGPASEPPPHY